MESNGENSLEKVKRELDIRYKKYKSDMKQIQSKSNEKILMMKEFIDKERLEEIKKIKLREQQIPLHSQKYLNIQYPTKPKEIEPGKPTTHNGEFNVPSIKIGDSINSLRQKITTPKGTMDTNVHQMENSLLSLTKKLASELAISNKYHGDLYASDSKLRIGISNTSKTSASTFQMFPPVRKAGERVSNIKETTKQGAGNKLYTKPFPPISQLQKNNTNSGSKLNSNSVKSTQKKPKSTFTPRGFKYGNGTCNVQTKLRKNPKTSKISPRKKKRSNHLNWNPIQMVKLKHPNEIQKQFSKGPLD